MNLFNKTYAQVQYEKNFNWNKFLNKKTHTAHELFVGMTNAGLWTTCACGNQCAIIPRKPSGEPKDELLSKLGMQFANNITSMNSVLKYDYAKQQAKETLEQIEMRSELLIARLVQRRKKAKK